MIIERAQTYMELERELDRLRASHDRLLAAAKDFTTKLGDPELTLTAFAAEFTALENAIAAAEEQAS